MKVKMIVNADNMTREDLRAFIQRIREWELTTKRGDIVGILIDTDPQMSSAEAKDIFKGIFPEFKHLVDIPRVQGSDIRLGKRDLAVKGEVIGTVEEVTLTLCEASEEDIRKLEGAQTIQLVKISKG